MRKLCLKDIVKTAKIIKKANLREEIRRMSKEYTESVKEEIKEYIPVKTGSDEESMDQYNAQLELYAKQLSMARSEAGYTLGIDIVMLLIDVAANDVVEDQVYDLFAGIFEKTKEEISGQSLDALLDDIEKLVNENDIANFWKRVNQLQEIRKE